jgi:hypothetical protein
LYHDLKRSWMIWVVRSDEEHGTRLKEV